MNSNYNHLGNQMPVKLGGKKMFSVCGCKAYENRATTFERVNEGVTVSRTNYFLPAIKNNIVGPFL